MDPADVPTIEEILEEFDIQDWMDPKSYARLLAELQNRENIMCTDLSHPKTF